MCILALVHPHGNTNLIITCDMHGCMFYFDLIRVVLTQYTVVQKMHMNVYYALIVSEENHLLFRHYMVAAKLILASVINSLLLVCFAQLLYLILDVSQAGLFNIIHKI